MCDSEYGRSTGGVRFRPARLPGSRRWLRSPAGRKGSFRLRGVRAENTAAWGMIGAVALLRGVLLLVLGELTENSSQRSVIGGADDIRQLRSFLLPAEWEEQARHASGRGSKTASGRNSAVLFGRVALPHASRVGKHCGCAHGVCC